MAQYVYNVCSNNIIYAKYLLSFWESEILVCARQSLPMQPGRNENTRYWVSNELPWLLPFHMYCHNSFLGNEWPLWLHWERILGNMGLVFPGLPSAPFLFADFALYCFAGVLPVNPWTLEGGLILESGNAIETEENNFYTWIGIYFLL